MRPGFVNTYDPTPVKCFPNTLQSKCGSCARFSPGLESGGKQLVIDPPAILRGAQCPMWLRKVH